MRSPSSPPAPAVKKVIPYTCEQLFDLVADIERYPAFLSGWVEARILEQTAHHMRVIQQLGLPHLSQSFVSNAQLERPSRLNIHSQDGPFRDLDINWQFQPIEGACCEVELTVRMILKSRILDRLAGTFHDTAARDILSRFESRAHELYGSQVDV